jgi:hypothetical protein
MLERHHVPTDPDTAWFWEQFGGSASVLVGGLAIVTPPTVIALWLNDDLGGPAWMFAVIALGASLALMAVFVVSSARESRRPVDRLQQQEQVTQALAADWLQAEAVKARRRELGMRWFQRLPTQERRRIEGTASPDSPASE